MEVSLLLALKNISNLSDHFFCLLDHLPTPPPVGPEIQKGLDLIYEGIRLQAERRKNNPNYAVDNAERERLNYLGLYIGN